MTNFSPQPPLHPPIPTKPPSTLHNAPSHINPYQNPKVFLCLHLAFKFIFICMTDFIFCYIPASLFSFVSHFYLFDMNNVC